MLFFVEAMNDGEDMNWFVRAEGPRAAFGAWRDCDCVQQIDPELSGLQGDVKVWVVPGPSGPIGLVDWVYAHCAQGRVATDFPESMEQA